jgi:hypothetical protein
MENNRRRDRQMVYEIRVEGVLDAEWSDWLGGLDVTPQPDGNTLLVGPLRDEAALHGLLNKIRDLGLPLLSVERKDPRR